MTDRTSTRLALVTGASGVIGSRLLAGLRASNWRTRALVHDRPAPGADQIAAGDLRDMSSLTAAVSGADTVLHLAAVTHARRARTYEEVNVRGAERLLEAAHEAGVRRFVYVSSRAAAEDGGAYSGSKLRAEAAVRNSPLEHVIVRLPEVYGAGSSEGVDQLIARARRGAPIPVVGPGDDQVCPVFIDDAVDALLAAANAEVAAGKTYTLAGECMSMLELAHACRRELDSASRVVIVPPRAVACLASLSRVLPLPIYPDQLQRLRAPKPAPSSEARTEIGFRPRSLGEGLRHLTAETEHP